MQGHRRRRVRDDAVVGLVVADAGEHAARDQHEHGRVDERPERAPEDQAQTEAARSDDQEAEPRRARGIPP